MRGRARAVRAVPAADLHGRQPAADGLARRGRVDEGEPPGAAAPANVPVLPGGGRPHRQAAPRRHLRRGHRHDQLCPRRGGGGVGDGGGYIRGGTTALVDYGVSTRSCRK